MRDLLERSLWTGVEAGLGVLTVEALSAFDVSTIATLQIAGAATVLTALKVLASGRLSQLNAE